MPGPCFALSLLPGIYAVCRLPPAAPIPSRTRHSPFISITRTCHELSIICLQEDVPEGIPANRGWRCLEVEGPLDLALTGVMAALAVPLAVAGISALPIATYDTDYLLVPVTALAPAIVALETSGHTVRRP